MPESIPLSIVPPLPSDRETLLRVVKDAKDFKTRLQGVELNLTSDQLPVGLNHKRALVLLSRDGTKIERILVAGLSDGDAEERRRRLDKKNCPTGFHRWN